MKASLPAHEMARLESLREYEVLDTPPEEAFDDLTLLAAHICQVPTAMVSLVDEKRQWFKSRIGLSATETSRDIAFCAHTILHADEVLEVRDAAADPRFADSPLVTGDQRFRFYAGAPLVAPDGHALGALCVMDRTPRNLSTEQLNALRALSRRVVAQLELRRQARKLVANEQETSRLLAVADTSRRALLSLLEDQKRAESALRITEERFRQVVENIHEVFWMADVEKRQILYVSPGYEPIWGRTCESLYAAMDSWLDSIHLDDRARVLNAAQTKQVMGDYDETYRIVRPDKSIRWIRDRAFPVKGATGPIRRVVGVAEDITEQKNLEAQFLRAQRLEAIGTLSSGIAHDLNNILAPMLIIASLLKGKLTEEDDLNMLAMVEQGAQRGAGIIRQLLTFSRGVEGERGAVQVRHLVKEMGGIMRETFPRDITIEENAATGLWVVVADATQLHQVLMNLCVNARDAMPDGGKLTLSANNVTLHENETRLHPPAQPGPYVVMVVGDTGSGVPPEIVERIFEPFFTTKELGKGTGLGLSTVLGIVRSHNGFVTVTSEPGRGSAFKVYLPATPASVAGAAVPDAAIPFGQRELVLVADDEASIRLSVTHILQKNNYRVLTAANGQEALNQMLMHRDRVRVLITDLMMPVMGGVALIRAARAFDPKIKIIAATGLYDAGRQGELAAMGVADVMMKPFGPNEILEALRRALAVPAK